MAGTMQQGLPIRPFKATILETVAQNDFTIIIGETGSGKTTQVAQVWKSVHLEGYSTRSGLVSSLKRNPSCVCRCWTRQDMRGRDA